MAKKIKHPTHGVYEQEQINDKQDLHFEELTRCGYSIIENVLSEEEVKLTREKLYKIYDIQCEEAGGETNLRKISDHKIIRSMFAYDMYFIKNIISNPALDHLITTIMDGRYVLYSQVGVISTPSDILYQRSWHREVQYQHFTSSRPLAVQTLFILDNFSVENGGTEFIPASHMFEKFPSEEFCEAHVVAPEIKAGSVVLMNSMLYHRAGLNQSKNDRLLITNTFCRPMMATQFNYKKMVNESPYVDLNELTEKEKEVLGYRWDNSITMTEWRTKRIQNNLT